MKKLIVVVAVAALFDVALATGSDDKWWPDYGANAANSHFAEPDQINKSNVGQLEVAWFYPYGQTGFNPIVIDGMMYVLGRNNSLIALDPTTGKEIWIHERLNGITSRGINYWRSADGKDRRLIFAINGYMQAIDAKSGKVAWSILAEKPQDGFTLTAAPLYYNGLLIVGFAGAELGVRGRVKAFEMFFGNRIVGAARVCARVLPVYGQDPGDPMGFAFSQALVCGK